MIKNVFGIFTLVASLFFGVSAHAAMFLNKGEKPNLKEIKLTSYSSRHVGYDQPQGDNEFDGFDENGAWKLRIYVPFGYTYSVSTQIEVGVWNKTTIDIDKRDALMELMRKGTPVTLFVSPLDGEILFIRLEK